MCGNSRSTPQCCSLPKRVKVQPSARSSTRYLFTYPFRSDLVYAVRAEAEFSREARFDWALFRMRLEYVVYGASFCQRIYIKISLCQRLVRLRHRRPDSRTTRLSPVGCSIAHLGAAAAQRGSDRARRLKRISLPNSLCECSIEHVVAPFLQSRLTTWLPSDAA